MNKNENLIELLTKAVKAWYEDYKRTGGRNCYLSYNAEEQLRGEDTATQEHTKQRLEELKGELLECARGIVRNICEVDRFDRNRERIQSRIDDIEEDIDSLLTLNENEMKMAIATILKKYKKNSMVEIQALLEHLEDVLDREYSSGRGSYDNDYTLFDGDNRPADFTEKEKEDCAEMVAGWLFAEFPEEYLNEYLEDDELSLVDFDY